MVAALVLGGMLMLRLTEQSLIEQKMSQLRILTETLARSLANSPDSTIQEQAYFQNYLQRLPDELLVTSWRLYDSDLQLTVFEVGEDPAASTAQLRQVRFSGQPFEILQFPTLLELFAATPAFAKFIQPITQQGRIRGLLEIRFSLSDIRQRLQRSQQLTIVYVVLYATVLIFVGYYLLQRNVVRPAHNLLRATEDVGRGNLETRLPIAGPVEFAQLATAYNHMVQALQESRAETEAHIAALEQSNQQLQQTQNELIRSEKLASVGQLAAGLAHELGNPLAALIGYLEVLKVKLEEGTEQDIVERSLSETSRIDFLVRELLDFSRPEGDTQIEPVDLAMTLPPCVRLLQNQGVLDGVRVDDRLPDNLPPVSINPNKLQQVFVNMLLNAAQACGSNGRIELSGHHDQENVWVTIADNGGGIGEDELGKIFDPFYTTKDPGQGTGLGLAICQRIVAEAGGEIHVDSQLSRGTCFKLSFPVKGGGGFSG
jgi:signal transduction histidine kinase